MRHSLARHHDHSRSHATDRAAMAIVACFTLAATAWAGVTLSTAAWSEMIAADPAPPVREITFPVLGPVSYSDDYGDCRDDCDRYHQGNDLVGVKMQPLVAAVDGTVTTIHDDEGNHGIGITITDAEGWSYLYLHVNNDTPGEIDLTDPAADRALQARWQMPTAITVGATVRAGQVIAWMGNSGNAEHSVPHLHFEIIGPDGAGINPSPSLRLAEWVGRCADPSMLPQRPTPVLSPPDVVAGTVFRFATVTGRGSFTISSAGGVLADGDATSFGDPERTNPSCTGKGPVLTARALPVDDTVDPGESVDPTDTTEVGAVPGGDTPSSSVAAGPTTTLPPDIEDGRDG